MGWQPAEGGRGVPVVYVCVCFKSRRFHSSAPIGVLCSAVALICWQPVCSNPDSSVHNVTSEIHLHKRHTYEPICVALARLRSFRSHPWAALEGVAGAMKRACDCHKWFALRVFRLFSFDAAFVTSKTNAGSDPANGTQVVVYPVSALGAIRLHSTLRY